MKSSLQRTIRGFAWMVLRLFHEPVEQALPMFMMSAVHAQVL
jgi:hypothetical protein